MNGTHGVSEEDEAEGEEEADKNRAGKEEAQKKVQSAKRVSFTFQRHASSKTKW